MQFTHSAKNIDKVVFIGDTGVGKTTALETISESPVINTYMESTSLNQTNVMCTGFDYGRWDIEASKKTYIFSMPSNVHFNPIWDIVLPDISAAVIWVRGDTPTGVADSRLWLERLKSYDLTDRLCLAVTRVMANDEAKLNEFRNLVAEYHPFVPVITADPREKDSVIQAITVALSIMYLDA